MSELITAINGIGEAFAEFRKSSDQKLTALTARLDKLDEQREIAESLDDRPSASGGGGKWSKDDREHKKVFTEWLRAPADGHAKRRLEDAQQAMQESAKREGKAHSTLSNAAGAYAVPEIIATDIERRVSVLNPFRGLCRVVEVGSRDWKALVSSNDLSNGWVGDGDNRSESTTSRLFERAPTFGTVYSYPFASEEVVQDAFFDIAGWLAEEAADGFAAAEATAIVSGNGTSKPTGFLNTTPTTSADNASPERAAHILEYLPINPASSPTTTIGDEALADALISLSYAVHERFTLDSSATAFVMRRSTAARVRKLKDQNDQYLWANIAAGQPATLLGHPVVLTDAMPAIANDAFPIAFGNWRRGYVICDRVGTMQITHDNNITTPGKHKFYMRRVVGGCILNHQAVKVLRVGD